MKIKIIFIVLMMGLLGGVVFGEKIADLSEVMRPFSITVGQGRFYVTEQSSRIHIYNIKGNKAEFVKTFGKEGEGPGEFAWIHRLRVVDDWLEIPTFRKYARFTLNGELIDEIKLPFGVFKNAIYRVGKSYLVRDLKFGPGGMDISLKLFGPDLKEIALLGKTSQKNNPDRLNLWGRVFSGGVSKNLVYKIESDKGTRVSLYDHNGQLQKKVDLPVKPLKFDDRMKERLEKELQVSRTPEEWKRFKKRLYYPEYTPSLSYFTIVNRVMIARTYRFKEDRVEFVFMDMNGKEIKRMYLWDSGRTSNGLPFLFSGDYYYYIKENFEEEVWELYREKVF